MSSSQVREGIEVGAGGRGGGVDLESLRPMSLGEVLDRSMSLCRRNLGFFVGTCAPGVAASYLLQKIVFAASHSNLSLKDLESGHMPDLVGGMMGSVFSNILLSIALLAVTAWTDASLIRSIADRFLGNPSSLVRSFRTGLERMATMAIAGLIASVVIGLGFLALLVPGFFFMIWLCLYGPAAVIERRGPLACLSRSRELMRMRAPGKRKPTLAERQDFEYVVILHVQMALVAALAGFALIPGSVFLLGLFLAGGFPDPVGLVTRMTPLDALVILGQAAVHPFLVSILVLFYYNVRMRMEGLDLDLKAQILAASRPTLAGAGAES